LLRLFTFHKSAHSILAVQVLYERQNDAIFRSVRLNDELRVRYII